MDVYKRRYQLLQFYIMTYQQKKLWTIFQSQIMSTCEGLMGFLGPPTLWTTSLSNSPWSDEWILWHPPLRRKKATGGKKPMMRRPWSQKGRRRNFPTFRFLWGKTLVRVHKESGSVYFGRSELWVLVFFLIFLTDEERERGCFSVAMLYWIPCWKGPGRVFRCFSLWLCCLIRGRERNTTIPPFGF